MIASIVADAGIPALFPELPMQRPSVTPETLAAPFGAAATIARAHLLRHLPDEGERAAHEAVITSILDGLSQVGDPRDGYQPINVAEQLGEQYNLLVDWPIEMLQAARDYCHHALINGDGAAQSGMGPASNGLDILRLITEPKPAQPWQEPGEAKVQWTPAVNEAVQNALAAAGLTGGWTVSILTVPPGSLCLAMAHCMGSAEADVDFPPTVFIEPTRTLVLRSEVVQYREMTARDFDGQAQAILDEAQRKADVLTAKAKAIRGTATPG